MNRAIRDAYLIKRGDSQTLFGEVLKFNSPVAWTELEQCVTEKRLTWFAANRANLVFSGDPVWDGFKLFYFDYLRLSVPQDGQIILVSREQVISRWWNACPTLDACQALGLATTQVCRQVYEHPVEALLKQVEPRLRFERSYIHIRPFTPYCEERVWLDSA